METFGEAENYFSKYYHHHGNSYNNLNLKNHISLKKHKNNLPITITTTCNFILQIKIPINDFNL
jgi:hypothetical protein